jgi:hypothetical protein
MNEHCGCVLTYRKEISISVVFFGEEEEQLGYLHWFGLCGPLCEALPARLLLL